MSGLHGVFEMECATCCMCPRETICQMTSYQKRFKKLKDNQAFTELNINRRKTYLTYAFHSSWTHQRRKTAGIDQSDTHT